MGGSDSERRGPGGACCPFLEPAQHGRIHAIGGYCGAVCDGILKVPTLDEYRRWCSTADHPACPLYRARRWGEGSEVWAHLTRQAMAFVPATGVRTGPGHTG